MPKRLLSTLVGLGLVGAGFLFIVAQNLSGDHLHAHWRSLGLGDLDIGVNSLVFAVILVGAIIMIVTALRTMKDPN